VKEFLVPTQQLRRYLVAGGAAALLHLGILAALVSGLAIPATIATVIGFCAACALNYTIQYHWTFAAKGRHTAVAVRYVLVTFLMLGVNTAVFWTLYRRAGAPYLLAQMLATGVVVLLNYESNRRYTFKNIT
jgi:putative flippase GtrA